MTKEKQNPAVLQIGSRNWQELYNLEDLDWYFWDSGDLGGLLDTLSVSRPDRQETDLSEIIFPKVFQAIILSDESYDQALHTLEELLEPHHVFCQSSLLNGQDWLADFLRRRLVQEANFSHPQSFLDQLKKVLFDGQYGHKLSLDQLRIKQAFSGKRRSEGNRYVHLSGSFGLDYTQIAYFTYNIPYEAGRPLEIFFDHKSGSGVDTQIRIQLLQSGSYGEVVGEWVADGQKLEQIRIDNQHSGYLAVSLFARGEGNLQLGPCHWRFSRLDWGQFLLGGQRLVDKDKDELMTYFHPQDFKPPLCVYFSGYRRAEGFEGYWMMKDLGSPFLLICDPRLEGGAFYLGSPELERQVVKVIEETLSFLGFERHQLILSGLSMGTYGALYYGTKFSPAAIILGKPILSLGDLALGEKLERSGGFATSLDLLRGFGGDLEAESCQALNQRFWEEFKQADWLQTQLAIAYMADDDYDKSAFEKILEGTRGRIERLIGRSWPGRHNDQGGSTVNWFVQQYRRVLQEKFGRGARNEG